MYLVVTKHEFWGLLILKSQHLMLPNLTWNETWNDTSLKKSGEYLPDFGFNKTEKAFNPSSKAENDQRSKDLA